MNIKKVLKQYFFILTEESFVFATLIKWVFLSGMIGALVGVCVNLFLKTLDFSLEQGANYPHVYLVLPLIFVINRLVTRYVSPDSAGHGTEKVIKAVHKRDGDMRFRVVPIKFCMTILTLGFGGSAGKEGPCAQIGAALSSSIAKFFNFTKEDRKKMVICGVSAGFASVFGTPIAGAIFGVEVLFVGRLVYEFLLPSVIAGIVSYQVTQFFGGHSELLFIMPNPEFTAILCLKVLIAALVFGIGCIIFIEMMRFFHFLAKNYKTYFYRSALIAGTFVIGIYVWHDTVLWGLGLNEISLALQGETFSIITPFLKTLVTGITLHFGGSGGILTPILFVGSTLGTVIGKVFQADPAMFAALGFVSFLAGTANTPIASCLLAIELFGAGIAPYACLSCILSFLVSGYRSVYPAQIMSIKKTKHSYINLGESISKQQPHLSYHSLRKISKSKRLLKKLKNKLHLSFFSL